MAGWVARPFLLPPFPIACQKRDGRLVSLSGHRSISPSFHEIFQLRVIPPVLYSTVHPCIRGTAAAGLAVDLI